MRGALRWTASAAAVVAAVSVLAVAFRRVFWPWQSRWGATDAEVARVMPGDRIVGNADFVATRGISIAAPPERVWPWLVQIGSGRAGWYSYDRIDNGGAPSATRILPEHQQRRVGDRIPMIPGKDIGPTVTEIDPPRRMLWCDDDGEFSWEWLLEPSPSGETRLVSRLRVTAHPWTRRMAYEAVASVGDVIMQRRMLNGIKRRAEQLANSDSS